MEFWLETRMADLGLGDTELAEILGVIRTSVANWRREKRLPSTILGNPEKLKTLASALKMTSLDVLNASGFDIGFVVEGLRIPAEARELIEILASAPPNLIPPIIGISMIMAKQILAGYPNFDPKTMENDNPTEE